MKIKLPSVLVLTVILSTLLSGCFTDNTQSKSLPKTSEDTKKYAVTFTHKGEKTGKPLTSTLYKLPAQLEGDDKEKVARYFMDVVSVFCGENVCKIDKVRLFWNELGVYHHFELAKGVQLEKGNGLDFEPEDYLKLDKVLSNANSGLKLLEKHELVTEQSGGNGADALTGATVSLHKNDYITGAIWTCYTLWHFAHGDMQSIIRDYTGDDYSLVQLQQLLINGNSEYQLFVLEQLIHRKAVDDITRKLVIEFALQPAGGETELSALQQVNSQQSLLKQNQLKQGYIKYIEQLPIESYFIDILKFVNGNDSRLRWLALKSLQANAQAVPQPILLAISRHLAMFDSYQQVNLFLTILKSQPLDEHTVTENTNNEINLQLIKLLEHENFIMARAIFWTLSEQKVTPVVQQKLTDFEQKYGHKL